MEGGMIYIENESMDPYFYFGLEYYLTTEKDFGNRTILLFWRTSPTLMIGKYQNTLEEINEGYVKEKGIHIIRRKSGGGTIYTDPGGWQFSFITRGKPEQICFRQYTEPILAALKQLGVKAEFNGRNDLVIADKKISGNAQYMHNGFVVHHGSLLYSTDLDELVKSTTAADYKMISKGIRSVRDRVVNISDTMQHPPPVLAFRDYMVEKLLGSGGIRYRLNDADLERISELAKEKFNNWNCIYGKNPAFHLVRQGHFEGGTMKFHFEVAGGMIKQAMVYGDFFGNIDAEEIAGSLAGCPFESGHVYEALNRVDFEKRIYKMKAADVVKVILGV